MHVVRRLPGAAAAAASQFRRGLAGPCLGQAAVFVQSHVRSHVELMWLLSSDPPIGCLNKMFQFKEKSRKAMSVSISMDASLIFGSPARINCHNIACVIGHFSSPKHTWLDKKCLGIVNTFHQAGNAKTLKTGDENMGAALLTYLFLMAADILLYQVCYEEMMADPIYLDGVLAEGAAKGVRNS